MSYMSRVFNSSECSLNDDLLSAWGEAVVQRAIQDQMKADLVCISGQDNTSNSAYCSSANSTSTSSSMIGSPSTLSSFSTSSTLDLSPCGCTSENDTGGGISDTLLEHLETYIENVTDIRAGYTNLFNMSPSSFARSDLISATSWASMTNATEGKSDGGVLGDLAATAVFARCASRCSCLAHHYASFEGRMCGTILTGLSQLGFPCSCSPSAVCLLLFPPGSWCID